MKNDIDAKQARIESLQIENSELAERHQQFVRQVDESREQDQTRLADTQSMLLVEKANLERCQAGIVIFSTILTYILCPIKFHHCTDRLKSTAFQIHLINRMNFSRTLSRLKSLKFNFFSKITAKS